MISGNQNKGGRTGMQPGADASTTLHPLVSKKAAKQLDKTFGRVKFSPFDEAESDIYDISRYTTPSGLELDISKDFEFEESFQSDRRQSQNGSISPYGRSGSLAGAAIQNAASGLSSNKGTPRKKLFQYKKRYYKCLDMERFRAEYDAVRSRILQSHVVKANEFVEGVQKETTKKKGRGSKEDEQNCFECESFENPVISQYNNKYTKDKKAERLGSTAARRLGLAKADEFTGSEAEALQKLLKTLHTKTWDPQLYFHIRFFSIRNKLHHTSEETKILIRKRWRFILRMIKTMTKIEHALAERSYEKTKSCITYLDMVEALIKPICWGPNNTLPFDKNAYKVHADTMLSFEVQSILTDIAPEDRTPENIEQMVISLQYVHAFARLPTFIQHSLVIDAYYLCVGSKRIVLRQGHIPQNYYFVLHGQAVCKRFLACNGETETTAILRKGDGFGSVAIFNNCRRLVTVVSQTPLHLLVVPREAFTANFIHHVQDPITDTIQFLSKMWFMRSWPIELLKKCPHQCHLKQFRRTEIIEADVAQSLWIYVITKGVCKVYQKISEPANKTQSVKETGGDSSSSNGQSFSDSQNTDVVKKNSSHRKPRRPSPGRGSHKNCPVASVSVRIRSVGSRRPGRLESKVFTPHQSAPGEFSVVVPSSSTSNLDKDKTVSSVPTPEPPTQQMKGSVSPQDCRYKLVQTLRQLDVFGLEDLHLDPKQPPPRRQLLLMSDDAECAMLSKRFYLRMAGQQLRKKVYSHLAAHKQTHSQITSEDCLLIPMGGIQRDPDAVLDPIQPEFCIHC